MLGMCAPEARARIRAVLSRVGLPTAYSGNRERILAAMRHDKKAAGTGVFAIFVPQIGQFTMEHISFDTLTERLGDIGSETV